MTSSLQHPDLPVAADSLVDTLQSTLDATLAPLVPPGQPVALLDFPVHDNCGDSAIWLGARATLGRLGARSIAYTSTNRTFSRRELIHRVGNGTIFLSGGGNFGDLYPPHQELREKVIASCPDNPIVQLPQSIYYDSEAAIERTRRVLEAHPRFTLMIRDRRSLAIARQAFPGVQSVLCPDLAFGLGRMPRLCDPSQRVLWLSRTDRESAGGHSTPTPAEIRRVDWVTPRGPRLTLSRRFWRRVMIHPFLVQRLDRAIARRHLRRGLRVLCGARWVITDRLHGHVLALLLGIPHCLLANANGKVRAFYETWTQDSPIVTWCENESQAVQHALDSTSTPTR